MGFNFKQWYETNGDRLNETRKQRYHSDPEYRAHVLKVNRASRAKRTRSPRVGASDAGMDRSVQMQDGSIRRVPLKSAGVLAKALRMTTAQLSALEKKGHFPPTHLIGPAGRRLYSAEMIIAAQQAFEARGWSPQGEEDWVELHTEVAASWVRLGMTCIVKGVLDERPVPVHEV